MTIRFTLIYKTFNFSESKALDFETRNVFKKYNLHPQYMTQRKMKVLSKVDNYYRSLLPIHKTIAHAGFVVFVMPTAEADYNNMEKIQTLITEIKKEQLIENEEFHFVAAVYNGVCLSYEQIQTINKTPQETSTKSMFQILKNATSITTYMLHKCIAPAIHQRQLETFKVLFTKQMQKIYI